MEYHQSSLWRQPKPSRWEEGERRGGKERRKTHQGGKKWRRNQVDTFSFLTFMHANLFFLPQEKFGYICPDIAKEFNKYDLQPDKWFKIYEGKHSITKQVRMLYIAFYVPYHHTISPVDFPYSFLYSLLSLRPSQWMLAMNVSWGQRSSSIPSLLTQTSRLQSPRQWIW